MEPQQAQAQGQAQAQTEPRALSGSSDPQSVTTATSTPHTKRTTPLVPDGTFPGLAIELNRDDLEVITVIIGDKQSPASQDSPSPDTLNRLSRKLLRAKNSSKHYLPGQPRVQLHGDHQESHGKFDPELLQYLRDCHLTEHLDDLLPYMRYIFVQTPSWRHVMPLHHQQAHAREIMVNENPGLHLVWYYEKIFIKPIPAYFYSRAFWEYLEEADNDVFRAAVGFVRTYYFLIQYQIDFEDACMHRLIPRKPDGNFPTYEEFCAFIRPFTLVDDNHVNRRFHYGELRLTRINRTALLFRGRLAYFHIYPQWGSFLKHLIAPIITVFAVCSVVLNSMQVGLAALDMGDGHDDTGWPAFISVSLYFPVAVIVLLASFMFFALVGVSIKGVMDLVHGNTVRRRKKKGELDFDEKSHGMVW